jgi:DNA-binding transcriptional MerR regulator
VVEENRCYSIGELSRRSGLSVRSIRFYSDVGVVPVSAGSAAGYRLYDVEAVARLDLVRTLRELGLPLESIRALVHAQSSLAEVAAAHLKALDHQIQTLRLRYAEAFQTSDTPSYRTALLRRLEIANDPRTERYLNLLHLINGWPTQPSLSPIFDWFTCALRSHTSSSKPGV